MSRKARANILLLITAIIWGTAFVAQKAGTTLEPFTYNSIRTLIGFLALLPVIALLSKKDSSTLSAESPDDALDDVKDDVVGTKVHESKESERKTLIVGGIVCGTILAIASNLQQFGLYFDTDAGKAGFITTLYIVIVPVLGVFLRKRVTLRMWLCVIIGAVGFYMLTLAGKSSGFKLENGDLFVLLCAFVFSLHILAVDFFSPKCDGIKLSCMQFLVAGIIGFICMLLFESPKLSDILSCWLPILYTGILSSGVGYTLQVVAQKDADPTTASLIMSLESVFAVLAGVLFYHERLSMIELLGCVVIFAAVIISQLPEWERA